MLPKRARATCAKSLSISQAIKPAGTEPNIDMSMPIRPSYARMGPLERIVQWWVVIRSRKLRRALREAGSVLGRIEDAIEKREAERLDRIKNPEKYRGKEKPDDQKQKPPGS